MKIFASSVLLALSLTCISPSHAEPQTLVVGQINLGFYTASAAVVKEVLGRLGHHLQVVEGNHPDMYGRLGQGEIDLLIASWLPHAHGQLQAPIADRLVEASTLYEDARLYWVVPAHVPVETVRSIDDLKKPEVLARMDPLIVGVGPGSGLMNGSERIMRSYSLQAAGYNLKVAPAPEWSQRLADASANGRWMVMPLWQPQYLNALYPVRILEDPQQIFGVDRAVVVVRKEVWQQLPERSRVVIARIHLGIALATELERQMMVDGTPAGQVARNWMAANPATVEAWFQE
ncbi:glycine betaine ABC transporter substrate-binding protein [Pseudomonas azerbaijanoccidentalis]